MHTPAHEHIRLPTSANTYRQTNSPHLSSFARNSNQQREHWKPIRCSFFHIGLFDFACSKQTICPTIAMNITKKQECWFGVSSSQEARDVMATIMYSLILTAANGRETSKWLWTGGWGEGRKGEGESGKQWHHGPVLEYLNSHEAVLRTYHSVKSPCVLAKWQNLSANQENYLNNSKSGGKKKNCGLLPQTAGSFFVHKRKASPVHLDDITSAVLCSVVCGFVTRMIYWWFIF